jgi:hypothetical protein
MRRGHQYEPVVCHCQNNLRTASDVNFKFLLLLTMSITKRGPIPVQERLAPD